MIDEKLEKELEKTYKNEINDLTEQVGEIIGKYGIELFFYTMFLDARQRRKLIKELEKEEKKRERKMKKCK